MQQHTSHFGKYLSKDLGKNDHSLCYTLELTYENMFFLTIESGGPASNTTEQYVGKAELKNGSQLYLKSEKCTQNIVKVTGGESKTEENPAKEIFEGKFVAGKISLYHGGKVVHLTTIG